MAGTKLPTALLISESLLPCLLFAKYTKSFLISLPLHMLVPLPGILFPPLSF